MQFLPLIGRIFFSALFIMSGFGHFSPELIQYAEAQGVPFANVFVPFSGVLAILGGLSILFGFRARLGAALLVIFLVPVTVLMHNFWALDDPTAAQMQQTQFLKNLAMLGGALFVAYFGPGPVSVDSRNYRTGSTGSRIGQNTPLPTGA